MLIKFFIPNLKSFNFKSMGLKADELKSQRVNSKNYPSTEITATKIGECYEMRNERRKGKATEVQRNVESV